jgi:predicted amidohydrolase YtcJ
MTEQQVPELILHHGRFTTLDRAAPGQRGGGARGPLHPSAATPRSWPWPARHAAIDLRGRSVLPGLIDNHLHIIRGGLNYNMELRWDGAAWPMRWPCSRPRSPSPRPQWVRVVGGFTEHQFAEKRLPTLGDQRRRARHAGLHPAPVRPRPAQRRRAARGGLPRHPGAPGGEIVRDSAGNPTGLLLAKPNAAILYATLAKGPRCRRYQVNSRATSCASSTAWA